MIPIYVEATSQDTEVRLIKALRRRFPTIPAASSLPEIFDGMREDQWVPKNKKLLLVFDQFEQWLHARGPSVDEQLIQALRHCDGKRLQALCLVRDDFWLATTRFKNALDIELIDGHNLMLVDRFDLDHARKILSRFGHAYERLPAAPSELSPDQNRFLDRAIDGLAEENRVISVRLSLFAEMFKNRDWTTNELKKVGGIAGVGETFLEETFASRTALKKYKTHDVAARAILEELLPKNREGGSEIRGTMRTREDLFEVSTYKNRPDEFDSLLILLDKELRLITPANPDTTDLGENGAFDQRHFQLTHDYLVPSVKNWLTRKKKETWRGRAGLRISELAAQYALSKEKRHLPSFSEFVGAKLALPPNVQSKEEKQLLHDAGRRQLVFAGGWAVAVTTFGVAGSVVNAHLKQKDIERAVAELVASDPYSFEARFAELKACGVSNAQPLEKYYQDPIRSRRINALAAAIRVESDKSSQLAKLLVSEIPESSKAEARTIIESLDDAEDAIRYLTDAFEEKEQPIKDRIKYSIALLNLGATSAAEQLLNCHTIDASNRSEWIHHFSAWYGQGRRLVEQLNSTQSPSLISGLLLAMTQCDQSEFDQHLSGILATARRIYTTNRHAVCHAAAKYLLRHFLQRLPEITTLPKNGEWFVSDVGITMIKVPAGTLYQGSGVPGTAGSKKLIEVATKKMDAFWMSDSEITVGQFRQFLRDETYPGPLPNNDIKIPQNNAAPIDRLTVEEVVMFCDWLNWKLKKPNNMALGNQKLTWSTASGGYRIPTHSEMEYAARSGTNTRYFFGKADQRKYLNSYVSSAANSAISTKVMLQNNAIRMPNQFGLFDTLGNASETCLDDRQFSAEADSEKQFTIRFGSNCRSSTHHFSGWFQLTPGLDVRLTAVGFRVVFSIPKTPPAY